MSAPLPVSVVVVARNEAERLPRCLASVQGWVAEIVVALNDTVDSSEAVARSHGARIYHLVWQGYRDTKNAAMALAGHDWVLAIDADEVVSPELRRALTAFFARDDLGAFAGARFPRKAWFIDRWITHGDWYPDLSLRLFRRDRARWGGDPYVHEKVECDGPIADLDGDLHHHSFPDLASQIDKINLFADLFVRQQQAQQGRFSLCSTVGRPLWRFFRSYVIKRGFLDGFPGLYIATVNAFGAFARYSRLYEAEHRPDPAASRPQV